jgi:ferrous iron transport protein B
MVDLAKSRGYQINISRLSELLGAPVVTMVATRREGNGELLRQIVNVFEGNTIEKKTKLFYGSELEEHITELETLISCDEKLSHRFPPRWLAIKLLEQDEEVLQKLRISNE